MIKRFYLIAIISILFLSCESKVSTKELKTSSTKTTKVKSLNYNELKPFLEKKDDKTYIVNFWATWCAPCVKELPYFEKIKQNYNSKNVEVLLVSLDFPKQVEKKLIPFINRKQLKSEVVLLNDDNENFWIPEIDKNWSGAIPATLIYNKYKRKFFEKSFDYESLENELTTFLN